MIIKRKHIALIFPTFALASLLVTNTMLVCRAQTAAAPSDTRRRVVSQRTVPTPAPIPTPTPSQAPVRPPASSIVQQTTTNATTTTTTTPATTQIAPAIILTTAEALSAAQQNNRLKFSLNWTFGGRQQRGWYLYAALIKREIGTEKDTFTTDFAVALARWQDANSLTPNGILDSDTLYRMIAAWQARRIKEQDRAEALPAQLLTAPIIDFYDQTRALELLKVEKQTYAAYKRMVSAAAQDSSLKLLIASNGELSIAEKRLKIVSSFRSKDYQAQLRRQSPNAGRAGLAVNSPHFTGRALDLYVGGEPVDTSDFNRNVQVNTPVYLWLVKNAARFGFYPYYYEPWHWEYLPDSNAPINVSPHDVNAAPPPN